MENLYDLYPLKLSLPSLLEISMVKIVICLWKHPDTVRQIKQFLCIDEQLKPSILSEKQRNTFYSVFDKIPELPLPVIFHSGLNYVTFQLGINAYQWLASTTDDNKADLAAYLQWDFLGSIDVAETYRSLYFNGQITPDKKLRVKQMFIFCLEDCIYDYWSKLPAKERVFPLQTDVDCGSPVAKYWKHFTDEVSKGTPIEDIVNTETGQSMGIFGATQQVPFQGFKYFWSKSNNEQRMWATTQVKKITHISLNKEGLVAGINSLNFLVQCMIDSEHGEFCSANATELEKYVVDILLHWTWSDSFDEFVENNLKIINYHIYHYAMSAIRQYWHTHEQIVAQETRYTGLEAGFPI